MLEQPENGPPKLLKLHQQLSALNVTEVKPVHPLKASRSMLVTEFGIVTEVKPVHP